MALFHNIVNEAKIKKCFYLHSAGYIYVLINGKYRPEHRVFYERFMNRSLGRNEIVHHRNSNRKDNRMENLELLSRSRHAKLHWQVKTAKITRRQLLLFQQESPKQESLFAA